jgi:NADPH:quinone reductase-like Zn-dependent oxidoreductase
VAINNLKRMSFIIELATAGKLRPVIDRSYPLEQTSEAFKYVEKGRRRVMS